MSNRVRIQQLTEIEVITQTSGLPSNGRNTILNKYDRCLEKRSVKSPRRLHSIPASDNRKLVLRRVIIRHLEIGLRCTGVFAYLTSAQQCVCAVMIGSRLDEKLKIVLSKRFD